MIDPIEDDPGAPPLPSATPRKIGFSSRGNASPVGQPVSEPALTLPSAREADTDRTGSDLRRRYQARKQEEAAVAKKTVNAAREAQFRTAGQKFYADSFGNLQPEVDTQGKARFNETAWKKTALANKDGSKSWALARRSESGEMETRRPDLTPAEDIRDPNLYHDFGGMRGEREVAGHVDDLARSSDPEVARVAAAHRLKRNQALRSESLKPLQEGATAAEIDLDSARLRKSSLDTELGKLNEQLSAIDADPIAKQTAGGVLGFGAEPTEGAKQLAARRATLQAKADELSKESASLTASTEKGGSLYQRQADAKLELDLWANQSKMGQLDDLAEQRRAFLRGQKRSEKTDPVLSQILAQQQAFGVKASTLAQSRRSDDDVVESGRKEGAALALNPEQFQSRVKNLNTRRTLFEESATRLARSAQEGKTPAEMDAEARALDGERRFLLAEQGRLSAAQEAMVAKQKEERAKAITGLSDEELLAGTDSVAADLKERQKAFDSFSGDKRVKKDVVARVQGFRDNAQETYALLDAERKRRGLGDTRNEAKANQGVIESGVRGLLAGAGNINRMAAGVLATGGDIAGWDWLRDTANEFSEAQADVIRKVGPAISSLEDVDSVASAFKYMSGQVGQQAPIFGALKVATLMASGAAQIPAIARAVATVSGAKKAGNAIEAARKAGSFVETSAALGAGVALQTGSIQSNLLDYARDKFETDTAKGTATGDLAAYREKFVQPLPILTMGLATGVLEGLSGKIVLNSIGLKKQAQLGFFKILEKDGIGKRVLKSILAAEASEIPTELLQTLGERLATKWADPESEYFTPELATALKETAAATLVSTGAIGALGGIRRPANDAAIEDAVKAIENVAALGRNLTDLAQWQKTTATEAVELIPSQRLAALAETAGSGAITPELAAEVADLQARTAATLSTVAQIASAPDFVAIDPKTGEEINDPTTVGANRDAARALVKISNGYELASLTEAEQQGLETIGEQLGSEMVKDIEGQPVITDKARTWALDLVPAAYELIRETETQRSDAIAAQAQAEAQAKIDAKASKSLPKGAPQPNEKDQIQKEKGLLKPAASAAPAAKSAAGASVSFTDEAGQTTTQPVPADAVVPSTGAPVRDQATAEQYLAETSPTPVRDVQFTAPVVAKSATTPAAPLESAKPNAGKAVATPKAANVQAQPIAKPAAVAAGSLLPHLVKRMRAAGADDKAIATTARDLAKSVNTTVAKYSGLFGGRVQIVGKATMGDTGGVAYDANTDSLIISTTDLAADASALIANPERIDKIVREEAIHRAAVRLESSKAWSAPDLWNGLSDTTKDAFERVYNRGKGGDQLTRDENHDWRMGHEMVRMLVQGRMSVEGGKIMVDGAAISEETASPGVIDRIRDVLTKVRDYFTDLAGNLAKDGNDPQAVTEVNRVVELVTRKLQALERATTPPSPDTVAVNTAETIQGETIKGEWVKFAPESGTLGVPRSEMPQFQNEHLGALTQFLKARGIDHQTEEVLPGALKPTQEEYSTAKVKKVAKAAASGKFAPRSILVSSDGYVLDRHHQFVAALTAAPDTPIPIIRFSATIQELFDTVLDFPSVEYAGGAKPAPSPGKAETKAQPILRETPSANTPTLPAPKAGADQAAPAPASDKAALAQSLGIPEAQIGSFETVTHKGKTVRVVNLVLDASQVETSHSTEGAVNPGYPQALQPRDRSLAIYRDQERRMAANPDISEEMLSGTPDRGTPILANLPNGGAPIVLVGNGRASAKALMYSAPDLAETAARFKAAIAARAAEKGLTPDAVNAVARPVLVRHILDPLTLPELRTLSKNSNEFSGAATNAVEQGKVDASLLTPAVLSYFDPEFDLDAAKNDEFRREFVRQVIGRAENITGPDLRRRVQAALFAKAFADTEAGLAAFSRLAGEDDEGTRNLVRSMLDVAPAFAAMRQRIADGTLQPLDLAPALTRAVQEIAVTLREKPARQATDAALDTLVNQTDLALDGKREPLDDAVLRFLIENRRNRADLSQGLSAYVSGVYAEGDPNQANMFGEAPRTTLDVFQSVAGPALASAPARVTAANADTAVNFQVTDEQGNPVGVQMPAGRAAKLLRDHIKNLSRVADCLGKAAA